MTPTAAPLPHFLDLDSDEVREHLARGGPLPPRLVEMGFQGIHQRLAPGFDRLDGLGPSNRARFAHSFAFPRLEPVSERSGVQGRKFAFRLADGAIIESVLIERHGRHTLCVSSQAGCAMACGFCATGRLGLLRNLAPWEIVDQVLQVSMRAPRRVDGLVFMGMGEPLQNEDAVLRACRIFQDRHGLQISPKKTTISTVGVVPAIRRFARLKTKMTLVFSLVSAVPHKREELVPLQKRWGFEELMDAIAEYSARRRNPHVTLEYLAIKDRTMGAEDVAALRDLKRWGFPFILNVIPWNPVPGFPGGRPTREEVDRWAEDVRQLGFPVKVRFSAAQEAAGGCGQLGSELLRAGEEGRGTSLRRSSPGSPKSPDAWSA